MGHGFLLTSVFEQLEISLQKMVGFQVCDEIVGNTLVGCGFKAKKGGSAGSEQEIQTPIGPAPKEASTSSGPTFDTLVQDQRTLKGEIAEVKKVLTEEKALNVKCHEDILSALSTLTAKFSSPFTLP